MSLGFTFNNKTNSEFGLDLISTDHLNSPSRRFEEIVVPGRNGTLVVYDGCFNNAHINIKCFLHSDKKTLKQAMDLISSWLLTPVGYSDLTFTDGSVFKAICDSAINVVPLSPNMAEVTFSFSAYKER